MTVPPFDPFRPPDETPPAPAPPPGPPPYVQQPPPHGQQPPPDYGQTPYAQAPYAQPQYAQNPYAQNPYGQQAWGQYPTARTTNGFAIASMVLGILWIYWVGSVLALVFGYIARGQIRRQGQNGDGMAIAGIVLGWLGIAMFVFFLFVLLPSTSSTYP